MRGLVVVCLATLTFATITNGRPTSEEDEDTNQYNYKLLNRPRLVSPNKLDDLSKLKNKEHIKQKLPLIILTKDELTNALKTALTSIIKEQKYGNAKYIQDNDEQKDNRYFGYKKRLKTQDFERMYQLIDKYDNNYVSKRGRLPKRNRNKHPKVNSSSLNNYTSPEFLEAVNKLQDSVTRLNDNIILINSLLSQSNNLPYIEQHIEPVEKNTQLYSRVKRNVLNETRSNNIKVKPDEQPVTNGKNDTKNDNNEIPDEKEVEKILENASKGTEKPCNDSVNVDGRRQYNPETSLPVKNKLLSYLDLTYEEILNKLKPLSNIKQAFSNDDVYKIGYILANIDTLEANIKILKKDMDENKKSWTDERILEHFDKLIVSNKVITNLVDALNSYTKQNSPIDDLTRLLPDNLKEIHIQ